jgi:hypothetical protein
LQRQTSIPEQRYLSIRAAALPAGTWIGRKSFCRGVRACIMRKNMGDNTQLIRVRQSAGRHKITLVICALLVLGGFVGWLTTL